MVKKRQKDISGIEQKIISLYAKGMTTCQISDTIEDIYGFEVSDGMVSDITDRLLPQIEDWQKRPLDEVYPIVFIDAVHFSVRDNGQIRKLAAYVILAVSLTGRKEVLSIHIGENESAKYWLGVLNELKNRGVKDILVICADGLSGMKEAVNTAFPHTELQRCIVHQVRNTLKYVGAKNKKEFANDLKTIYHAPSEDAALKQLERVTEKWEKDYPNAMKSWYKNWDVISPIFKFSADVRKVIYTTNAIESLNSGYRRLNKQRSVFPSDTALLKALYLATHEITKKWTMPLRNWGRVLGELEIMYPVKITRKQAGRNEEPSYALIDSQSVKTTCYGENHGYDGEKTKGRKRHIVTDTMENLLCIYVHAANIHDTKGGVYTFEKALYRYPTIQAGCADGSYRGTFRNTFDEFHNIRIDISMQIKEQKGFQVLPKCWVVERTFAWLNGSRRLSKDYETSCCSAETMIMISHAAILLKRL